MLLSLRSLLSVIATVLHQFVHNFLNIFLLQFLLSLSLLSKCSQSSISSDDWCLLHIFLADHHKDQWPANLKVRKNIDPVGSCCTLVTEKLLALDLLDGQMASLLLGSILLDTINLDPRAGRATDKDRNIVKQLQDKFPLALDELYRSVSTG